MSASVCSGVGVMEAFGLDRNRRVIDRLDVDVAIVEQQVEIHLHLAASPTITGTMWLGFGMCGMPALSGRARAQANAVLVTGARRADLPRCWIEATAPAASAGGSAVVKMKPEAKERMKSQSAVDAAI